MNQLNVLQLAWKIFKNKTRTFTFRNALKLAWKICRQGRVEIKDKYFEIKSKVISLLNLFMVDNIRNGVRVRDEQYDLNVLFNQLNRI